MQNQIPIEFDRGQIEAAIFHKKSPTVVLFPFPVAGILGGVSVQVVVQSTFLPTTPVDVLCSVIRRVGDIGVDANWVRKQTPQVVDFLWKAYDSITNAWTKACKRTMDEICEGQISKSYWILQKGSLESGHETTIERGLWVLHNTYREATEQLDIVVKLRDSLLPWLQPEMYQKMKDKQEKTQTNVNYEKQHVAMLAGTFDAESDNLDIIE